MNVEQELADYLNQSGFQRFVQAWIRQYQRLGHLGGKIVLENLTDDEKQCLGGLGWDLSQNRLELTYAQFLKKLKKTRYGEADFLKTLEILNQSLIYSRKEIKELKTLAFDEFKENLFHIFQDTKSYAWLKTYLSTDRYVKRYFEQNQHMFQSVLENVCRALNQLPVYQLSFELLPVFSQNITKNPHYFDEDLPRELLLKGIVYDLYHEDMSLDSFKMIDVLYSAGILKDDLSNYCYICHIQPQKAYPSWQGFYEAYEPWNMNLYNINVMKDLFIPLDIFIFENPSVFRMMCDFIKHHKMDVGLVCSNGQINFCTYLLLDKLVDSGCSLYYAGDYDPEGLVIAEKLKQRYQDLHLFCYSVSLFEKIKIKQIDISSKRLQMLNQIKTDNLKIIAQAIQQEQAFGYQEGLIDVYQRELKKMKII